MIVEKKVNNVDREIHQSKLDMSLFKKRSTAKSAKGVIIGYMKKITNSKSSVFSKHEMLMVIQNLYKEVANLETSKKVKLDSWKGKSSFGVLNEPDKFIVITHQKKDQDSEPREVRREISKDEVNDVLYWINRISKEEKVARIHTRDIGEKYYQRKWEDVFSDRYQHTHLNYILRLLDYYQIIHYRGGQTQILKTIPSIQTFLKSKNI